MPGIELKPMTDAVNKFDFLGYKAHMAKSQGINAASNSEQTPINRGLESDSFGSPEKNVDSDVAAAHLATSPVANYNSSGNSFHSAHSRSSIYQEDSVDSDGSSLHPMLEGVMVDFQKMDASPKFVLFWGVINVLAVYYLLSFASFFNGHLRDYEQKIESYCNPLHMSHEFCVGDMWQNVYYDDISVKVRPKDNDADMVLEQPTEFSFSTTSKPPTMLLSVEPKDWVAEQIG